MEIVYDVNGTTNEQVEALVREFLDSVSTLESEHDTPIVIFQDGVSGSYYIKCSMTARHSMQLCDLNAKLDVGDAESFRANRELMLRNTTYTKMEEDASNGREFNDIIVEYNKTYEPSMPLKVWGGQHRISAIRRGGLNANRYHGFRIFFALSKQQRTEVALVSNTNINVSNDTFDRMVEETTYGNRLREWCWGVGLLSAEKDFPDVGSRSEHITVKKARSFIVNFYLGLERGSAVEPAHLDLNVYDPYLVETGTSIDPKYAQIMRSRDILSDTALHVAGEQFARLHAAQHKAVIDSKAKISNRKGYRNKAFVESVLCAWAFVAGLLQHDPDRLENHYRLPKTNSRIPDPLNAHEMSEYKHDSDKPTYRGLGTRSSSKDRQRIAQLFLAKSRERNVIIDKNFMHRAVNQVVSILYRAEGYA